jgi:hypothetical protein
MEEKAAGGVDNKPNPQNITEKAQEIGAAVELVIGEGEITGKSISFEGTRCSSIESMKKFHEASLKQ